MLSNKKTTADIVCLPWHWCSACSHAKPSVVSNWQRGTQFLCQHAPFRKDPVSTEENAVRQIESGRVSNKLSDQRAEQALIKQGTQRRSEPELRQND